MKQPLAVQWPDHYQPENCPVHVRNELDMAAPPAHVWAWLIDASDWPTWYINSANVNILEGKERNLHKGTRFRWKTFGVTITSTVLECVPGERIAWDGHGFGVDVYHAWVLQPSEKGCHVLTEESQHGWLARLSNWFMPKRMSHFHQLWLTCLETKAKKGLPKS